MVRELKHTEIGDIPVDWELQTFDETFRVISNNTLSRENLNNRGGAVRNIHYGDILIKFPEVLDCNEEEIPYVNELSLLSSSTQLLQDGDIVVADTAEDETVGKVIEVQNLGDSKLVAGLHTIPCRVKKGDFAPGWLGYYMNSDLFHNQILPYITGIKVSSISKGAISETLILVPPFDEQEKIVQSLNKIQLLMTAETKVVNKIKLVKNGCLSKMFPQKDDTVPEMRLPGFTEAWEQRKLSDFGKATGGTSIESEFSEDGLYKVISIGSYSEDNIYRDQGIRAIDSDKTRSRVLNEGDLTMILNDKTASGNIIGRALLIEESGVYVYNQRTERIEIDHDNYDSLFIYEMLNAPAIRDKIIKQSQGNTQIYVNWPTISLTEYLVPQIEEQREIGKYFSELDNLITLHQCKCDKYSNIKKGMMSDLLTGKIRLV